MTNHRITSSPVRKGLDARLRRLYAACLIASETRAAQARRSAAQRHRVPPDSLISRGATARVQYRLRALEAHAIVVRRSCRVVHRGVTAAKYPAAKRSTGTRHVLRAIMWVSSRVRSARATHRGGRMALMRAQYARRRFIASVSPVTSEEDPRVVPEQRLNIGSHKRQHSQVHLLWQSKVLFRLNG